MTKLIFKMMMTMKKFTTFKDFYPFYLEEHRNSTSRRLHFFGTLMVILTMVIIIVTQNWVYLFLVPILGYGFAWVGHFFFEKNKPATFQYPLYSLAGDFVMFKDILARKIPW